MNYSTTRRSVSSLLWAAVLVLAAVLTLSLAPTAKSASQNGLASMNRLTISKKSGIFFLKKSRTKSTFKILVTGTCAYGRVSVDVGSYDPEDPKLHVVTPCLNGSYFAQSYTTMNFPKDWKHIAACKAGSLFNAFEGTTARVKNNGTTISRKLPVHC